MKYFLVNADLDAESRDILREWAMTRGNFASWIVDDSGRITIAVDEKLGVFPTWPALESAYGSWVVEYTPE